MKFSVYQASHIGGRARNEDRVGYTYTRQAVLLVLADGMGGIPTGTRRRTSRCAPSCKLSSGKPSRSWPTPGRFWRRP